MNEIKAENILKIYIAFVARSKRARFPSISESEKIKYS